MSITTYRELPAEIRQIQMDMEGIARSYGLDFFETIFEMLDYEELSMFAAYGGFPVRYPHWRFGAQYDELMKGYSYGLQKIYEMVINTDPCYAYLLNCNMMTDQKLVIAHVYGHCDFFKNNAWFAPTNRKMLDNMANHATRIRRYIDRFGYEPVENFIDACLSIEDLIDMHSPHVRRKPLPQHYPSAISNDEEIEEPSFDRFPSKDYMDSFINPQELLNKKALERQQESIKQEESRSFPSEPEKDVLLFLIEHAPLKDWQHDILSIIRDEAYYFAPQGQTKIMNEGWASYWHSKIMTRHGLTDAELIDYADHHSGTMATSPTRMNPYKLGIELFKDIEERWDKGQFGRDWETCDDIDAKENWDLQKGMGRDKIFEVRKIYNDVTFIDSFLTEDFCRRHKMFSFAYNQSRDSYDIASREFKEVKQQMLKNLTNWGRPLIQVVNGNYLNRGELLLKHSYEGIELKMEDAKDTLVNLRMIWGRPVHIETVINDVASVISFNGQDHTVTTIGKK
jgi:stage V sporulation protein R